MDLCVSDTLGWTGNWNTYRIVQIESRFIGESFECVMGECDLEPTGDPSIFSIIRSTEASVSM